MAGGRMMDGEEKELDQFMTHYAAYSISTCLSKGLGAPTGSVLVGSKILIAKARRLRKALSRCMTQVGVLCEASYATLSESVIKLEDDHRKAKIIAEGLIQIEQISVDTKSVETNMVFFFTILDTSVLSPKRLCKVLEERGVLVLPSSSTSIRIILHYQISDNDVNYALPCIKQRGGKGIRSDAYGEAALLKFLKKSAPIGTSEIFGIIMCFEICGIFNEILSETGICNMLWCFKHKQKGSYKGPESFEVLSGSGKCDINCSVI
ncbi:hypothetical protein IEQ34_017494 [Dendrobium chrysotoxum]|uniref:Aromatic amino acid beta-eliminating lyase/threonine aldolase domain-containing protein n=1 Tax=Dendrobium chrysotoxum TaxID=161865 RepID=A0AAV7GBP5_DENCH|nr:hypothetical protein IEQ34_017494 [Dendrobium chrysotoxum]